MKTSEKYSLDLRDILKGLLIIVMAAVIDYVVQSINNGLWPIDLVELAKVSILAGCAYLTKNFFTPAKRISDP